MINILTIYTLWRREMVRFFRQPNRVIGALGSPLIFWLLIGSGVGHSFRNSASQARPGFGYLGYFFPGTLLMILLFTAIFSTISIIEDRHQGFLQAVLVAPGSRASLVMGKVLGGATLAAVQGLLFLLIAPLIGLKLTLLRFILVFFIMFLLAFTLTCVGFILAWQMDSVQGFHAIMNLFLMPMWLLSGALFPPEGSLGWLKVVMRANPLLYGMVVLKSILEGDSGSLNSSAWPALGISWIVTLGFAALIFVFCIRIASKRETGK